MCFSRLLSCTNSTIPCKISHIDLRRLISDHVKHLWRLLSTISAGTFIIAVRQALNPLSTNPTKWPNTLKQFVGKLPTNCLSVFDNFVKLTLIRLWFACWASILIKFFVGLLSSNDPNRQEACLNVVEKLVKKQPADLHDVREMAIRFFYNFIRAQRYKRHDDHS